MISPPATYADATGKQITPPSDRTPSTASNIPSSGSQHGTHAIHHSAVYCPKSSTYISHMLNEVCQNNYIQSHLNILTSFAISSSHSVVYTLTERIQSARGIQKPTSFYHLCLSLQMGHLQEWGLVWVCLSFWCCGLQWP